MMPEDNIEKLLDSIAANPLSADSKDKARRVYWLAQRSEIVLTQYKKYKPEYFSFIREEEVEELERRLSYCPSQGIDYIFCLNQSVRHVSPSEDRDPMLDLIFGGIGCVISLACGIVFFVTTVGISAIALNAIKQYNTNDDYSKTPYSVIASQTDKKLITE